MLFSNDIFLRTIIPVLGICGFIVAHHIYKHKKAKVPLICPVGFDCNFVVHSDYSEFMHVPLEIFGMIYYAFIFISYLFFIFMPEAVSVFLVNFMIIVSFVAFLFSVYLICVQIFILKKGCSWCIVSAVISISIFILTFFTYNMGFAIQSIIR